MSSVYEDGGSWEFFSSPPRPERLWGPPSLLSSGYEVVKRPGLKLTAHLHLIPKSKNAWSYNFTPPIRLYGMVTG